MDVASSIDGEELSANKNKKTTEEDVKFVDEVDHDLKCSVCLEVMKNPHQVVPCGHRYCGHCLQELLR